MCHSSLSAWKYGRCRNDCCMFPGMACPNLKVTPPMGSSLKSYTLTLILQKFYSCYFRSNKSKIGWLWTNPVIFLGYNAFVSHILLPQFFSLSCFTIGRTVTRCHDAISSSPQRVHLHSVESPSKKQCFFHSALPCYKENYPRHEEMIKSMHLRWDFAARCMKP